jgi:hypothetical protein
MTVFVKGGISWVGIMGKKEEENCSSTNRPFYGQKDKTSPFW